MAKCRVKPPQIMPRQYGRKPKHQTCNERCKSCVYSSKFPSPSLFMEIGCMYIVDTGHRRGCPAGNGCKRFVYGKRKETEAI